MLQILGRVSSINVRKVLWTAAVLNVPFEQEDWGAGFRPTSDPAFLAMNPNGLVPVIKDGDFVLWESNTIIRYLAARYGDPDLYPTEPMARARVDQWIDWMSADLNPAYIYAFLGLARQSPAHRDAALTQSSIERWTKEMRILEGQLAATGAFVAGPRFTIADISIGLAVNRWFGTPFEKPSLPAVSDYFARLDVQPGFAQFCKNGMP